jgi:hypothetical protein
VGDVSARDVGVPTDAAGPRPVPGHFRRLWCAESPLWRVVLVDMLVWGTLLNLCAGGISLTLIANDAPDWMALASFLVPLPYNLFLCVAVWRASGTGHAVLTTGARALAIVWLAGVFMF